MSDQVYWKFSTTDKDGVSTVNYIVQKLPVDRIDDAVEFFVANFVEEEPICQSKGLSGDQEAIVILKSMWREILADNQSLVCFKENCNEIIAVNLFGIGSKEATSGGSFNPNNSKLRDILSVFKISRDNFNVYDHYQVKKYLRSYGLTVGKEYRKRGIATQLLKARQAYMKDLGIQVSSAECTGPYIQRAAKNAGYEENWSLKYSGFSEFLPGLSFPGIENESFKIYSLKI